jgi:bacillithiol biosynthesis cysteine-adding enzyme BshC
LQQEIAREPSSGNAELQVSRVPFSALAHQSRLFLDYQKDPVSLRRYYPNSAASPAAIDRYAETVLANYTTDRDRLCSALTAYNLSIDAGERSLSSIRKLSESDTVAVVTGQQAGLFTGPLYTVYKALSAIKMAESLNERNIKAVPVFWIATEDHDFEEVSETSIVDAAGTLQTFEYVPEAYKRDVPVGNVEVDGNITKVISELIHSLPKTAFTDEVGAALATSWARGTYFGAAFAKNLAEVLRQFGMVFVDPLLPDIKALCGPIYERAIARSDQIVAAVTSRDRELLDDGYHAQVEVKDDYFPLFWHDDVGVRRALRKVRSGEYRVKGERLELSSDEMGARAIKEPGRFSPGVMLRPVVQDHLLPTICYFGGGAEIAYFAQNSEVYRVLDRPATPIFHRQSFTVVETKHRKVLERYGLRLTDLFEGLEAVSLKIAEGTMSAATARLFADVEEEINAQLHKLDQMLSGIDPTLAESLGKRRRKIIYHIGALRKKTLLAQVRRHADADRQIRSLFACLLPNGQLQERSINYSSFSNKFGPQLVDLIYRSIDLEDKDHRIVYL